MEDLREKEVSARSGPAVSTMGINGESRRMTSPLSEHNPEVESKLRQYTERRENEKEDARRQLEFGKRELECGKLDGAVSYLSYSCWKYSRIYGPLAPECGEVCMTYGQVLLQQWKKWPTVVKKYCQTNEPKATNEEIKENVMQLSNEGARNSTHLQDKENCLSTALRMLDRAKIIFGNNRDYKNLAKILSNMAEVRVHQSDFTAAANDFDSALFVLQRTSVSTEIIRASIHLKLALLYSGAVPSDNAQEELMKAYVSVGASLRSACTRSKMYYASRDQTKIEQLNKEISIAQEFVERLTKIAKKFPLEHHQAIEILKHDMEMEKLVYSECQEDKEVTDSLSRLCLSNKTEGTCEDVIPSAWTCDTMEPSTNLANAVDKYISELVQSFTREQEYEEQQTRQKEPNITKRMDDIRMCKRKGSSTYNETFEPDELSHESPVKKQCST